ncbi:hypothetical protein UMM65_04865 [Aureibaculum sp. 2210JD6-5]|uniref:hypothetical protein n=1 Tax=Aureibaculum sp. 2210JD6-5 TaxID=3103957 RepID=UPI002AAEDF03|nr:hypothetical protein [Aureibaculum sp. 2210JD6-5]MDY7394561.1 hypothetical protein [Aureibaculum sp. 2210JD6-5]
MEIKIKNIALLIIFLLVIIFIMINQNFTEKVKMESYEEQFHKVLTKEQFYFSGIIISTHEEEYGAGFLCLKKITTNKKSGYLFTINNNFVAGVYNNTIKYIGDISITNAVGELDKIKKGDSVNYNIDLNNKITIYRNNDLILKRDAFVYKVNYNQDYRFIDCE